MSDDHDLTTVSDELLWGRLGEAEGLAQADVLLELGRRAADRGERQRAVALFDEAADAAQRADDLTLAAHALQMQGGVRFGLGDYRDSAGSYQRAADHLRTMGRSSDEAWALWGRADALRAAGDFAEAIDTALASRALAEAEGLPELAGDASYILAVAYYYLDREEESLRACAEGRARFRSVGVTDKVRRMDDFALTVQLYLGNLDEALELARGCYVLAATTPDPSDDGYATRRLADVHLRRGEHAAARERAEEAREHFRAGEVTIGVARCDVILARVHRHDGQYAQALELFTEARVLFDSVGADDEARNCDTSRSILLHGLGQYREAAAVNRRLVSALGDEPDASGSDLPWAVVRLAENLLAAGEPDQAIDLLAEWMSLWDGQDPSLRASHRYALEIAAIALGRSGDAEQAASVAERALELTGPEEIDYMTAEMYQLRATWLLDAGDVRGRQDLAHAIALFLAHGATDQAAELAQYYLPEVRERHVLSPEPTWDVAELLQTVE